MKTALIVAVVILLALAGTAVGLYFRMGRPLYTPGVVRAGKLSTPLDPPSQADVPAGFLRVAPGIDLAFFSVGSGPVALALHGGPGFATHAPWGGLKGLEDRMKVVYYHQRGCGASTRPFDRLPNGGGFRAIPALDSALGLAEQIADIERLRRLLGEERIVLMGHSFGAFLAALYAAEFPEHTRGLVLIAPADLVDFPPKDGGLYEQIRRDLPAEMQPAYADYRKRLFDFRHILTSDEAAVAKLNREMIPFYAEAAKRRGYSMPNAIDTDNGGFMVQAMYLGMGMRHDYRAALKAVTAKVLVIHGSLDMQLESTSRQFVDYFPNARFVALEGVGHAIPEAAGFGPAVEAFLNGL